jgi:hypothetical protein
MPRTRRKLKTDPQQRPFDRVQTGVRLEKTLLKVLKALAEYHDISLGELLEVMALHSLEGSQPFSKGTLRRAADLRRVYDLEFDVRTAQHIMMTRERSH